MTNVATGTKLLNPQEILQHSGLEKGMKIADLGCGNGYFALTAAQIVGGHGQVYAVDIMKSCLETIKREAQRHHLLNIKTVWSNLEILGATKIPLGLMDFVLVIHALYQSQQKQNFLKEASRFLKIGGKLLIIDWKKTNIPLGPPLAQRVGVEEIKTLLINNNQLKLVEEFVPGEYHYGLLYEKMN